MFLTSHKNVQVLHVFYYLSGDIKAKNIDAEGFLSILFFITIKYCLNLLYVTFGTLL